MACRNNRCISSFITFIKKTDCAAPPRRCWNATENKQTLACLSKLQLLCVHPSLVVAAEDGKKRREMSRDVELSGKLMALRELLWDAGIGKRYYYTYGGDGDAELLW